MHQIAWLGVMVTCGFLSPWMPGSSNAAEHPNIIIIYGDDIGYGDFACYGGTGVDTPNVDALAKSGIRFLSGYCTAATCTPSRYSLLTGEYAFRNESAHILPGNAPLIIDPARPTIATFLRDNGYATGLSGKWHLGLGSADLPLDWNGPIRPGPKEVGFDDSFNMAATADRVPSVYIENGRIVDLDPADPVQVDYEKMVGNEPTGTSHPQLLKVQADEQHSGTIVNGVSRIGFMTGGQQARFKDEDMADTYLNKAIEFVRQHKDKPFFLYYAPNENHVPRVVHPRFQGSTSLGPRGDALAAFDWCVGRLIESLKQQGVYENTLIILSSDNGPVLFDGYWDAAIEKKGDHRAAGPWRGGKYSRWEGGTRMPFIVSWPEKIEPGISEAIVSQVDIFASVAALLGKPMPANAGQDGVNVLAALLGDTDQGREFVIQEALTQIAVRQGNWKYIPPGSVTERGGIGQWMETKIDEPGLLFHLADDPGETIDLAAQYPQVLDEMQAIIVSIAPEKATGQKDLNKKQLGF
jgi:arylsulfatase A-like enzyme